MGEWVFASGRLDHAGPGHRGRLSDHSGQGWYGGRPQPPRASQNANLAPDLPAASIRKTKSAKKDELASPHLASYFLPPEQTRSELMPLPTPTANRTIDPQQPHGALPRKLRDFMTSRQARPGSIPGPSTMPSPEGHAYVPSKWPDILRAQTCQIRDLRPEECLLDPPPPAHESDGRRGACRTSHVARLGYATRTCAPSRDRHYRTSRDPTANPRRLACFRDPVRRVASCITK